MKITAIGQQPLSYQWYRDGVPLPGETRPTLFRPNVQASGAGEFHVVVTNPFGSIISATALLAVVESAPFITLQPVSQTKSVFGSARFGVRASGAEPLSFQWQKDGMNIPGATNAAYEKQDLQFTDTGVYRSVVSNARGIIASDEVRLNVERVFAWGDNSPRADQLAGRARGCSGAVGRRNA